jgi:DNA processing protein
MTAEPAARPAGRTADRAARTVLSQLAEANDAVALLLVRRVGAVAALALMQDGGEDELLRALGGSGSDRTRVRRALERWRLRLAHVRRRDDIERFIDLGGRVVVPGDAEWPSGLDLLDDAAPFCLWVRGPGRLDRLTARSVAIVGSRAATAYGEHTARTMAGDLAVAGATVVSGGAYGIDAAAHRGALTATGGRTVAVLAGGLDRWYPASSAHMLQEVCDTGAVVSENPPSADPARWRFLARNRLIAALTGATVVVEAGLRSGALSTARHAALLGRPVGAVPGPITSPVSQGCHRIVREAGAVLVSDAEQALELIDGLDASRPETAAPADELDVVDPRDRPVLDALPGRTVRDVRGLALTCGLDEGTVRRALGRLEMLGLVARRGTGWRRARASAA